MNWCGVRYSTAIHLGCGVCFLLLCFFLHFLLSSVVFLFIYGCYFRGVADFCFDSIYFMPEFFCPSVCSEFLCSNKR